MVALALAVLAAGCTPPEPPPPSTPDGRPPKIMSLAPNVTEILFAMDLGETVVARTNYCTWPPAAAAIPSVGDSLSLDQEKILALKPTIAFLSTRRTDVPRSLDKLSIRAVPLQFDRLDQMYESVKVIGREVGHEDDAAKLLARVQADLRVVESRVKGRPRPRVLFAFPMTVGSMQMMVAGRGTFVDDLLQTAGADNAFPDKADWPMISGERAIALAPDVIIVNATGAETAPDRVDAVRSVWRRFRSIPAVSNGCVYVLTENYLTIPGPRIGLAASRLSRVIHPDAWPPLAEESLPPSLREEPQSTDSAGAAP
jgi:iron complex transport system substrate-binding protein